MIMTIHEKAIRLVEGGIVEIEADWFRLRKLPDYYEGISCLECDLDSICHDEHADVCEECEVISNRRCYLQLAHK